MTRGSHARKTQPLRQGRPINAAGTRERLLDCALSVFADKGYAAATTQEIIDAAGVSKPVLYHYCESKADLFRKLITAIHEAGIREWDTILNSESTTPQRLLAMTRSTFTGCANDPRIPRLMFQTHYGPPLPELGDFLHQLTARRFAKVCRVMHEGLTAGEISGGDAPSLALSFCCLLDQHCNVLARIDNPARTLTPSLAEALVQTFLHGVSTARKKRPVYPAFPLRSV